MRQEEKRASPRTEVEGVAWILQGHAQLQCQLRNISATGAKLGIADTVVLPNEIDVEIDSRRRRARVMWRGGGCMGVSFTLKRNASGFGRRSTPPEPLTAQNDRSSELHQSLARLKALLDFSAWTRREAEAETATAPDYADILARIGSRHRARSNGSPD